MKTRERTKSMLPVVLAVLLVACGGTTNDGSPSDTGAPTTSQSPTTSLPASPATTVEAVDPTTTSPSAVSLDDPCGLLARGEVEEAVGFALDAGTTVDLTAHGINGSSCFFLQQGGNTGNVSVNIVSGPQAAVLFDRELPEGGETIDGIGDRAFLALGDVQSNVYFLQGDVVVAIDIVHATGSRPEDLDERLTDLARTAAGRF